MQKIDFDTTENGPLKVCNKLAKNEKTKTILGVGLLVHHRRRDLLVVCVLRREDVVPAVHGGLEAAPQVAGSGRGNGRAELLANGRYWAGLSLSASRCRPRADRLVFFLVAHVF